MPPAFVLSQDQTLKLRNDQTARPKSNRKIVQFESCTSASLPVSHDTVNGQTCKRLFPCNSANTELMGRRPHVPSNINNEKEHPRKNQHTSLFVPKRLLSDSADPCVAGGGSLGPGLGGVKRHETKMSKNFQPAITYCKKIINLLNINWTEAVADPFRAISGQNPQAHASPARLAWRQRAFSSFVWRSSCRYGLPARRAVPRHFQAPHHERRGYQICRQEFFLPASAARGFSAHQSCRPRPAPAS
jgi:hypothetical protein